MHTAAQQAAVPSPLPSPSFLSKESFSIQTRVLLLYVVAEGQYLTSLLTHVASTDPRWSPEDAQQFRPERMLTPEGQKPGALLPFGHGPR
jgi:cytochrome P450